MRRIFPLIIAALVCPMVLSVSQSTSAANSGLVPAGGVLRVSVPEAVGGKTVVGQLTVDRAIGAGYVTAYGCDDGIPTAADGTVSRSDLNFDGNISPVSSNRLIVKADNNGDICFYTLQPRRDDHRHQCRDVRYRGQLVSQPSYRHSHRAEPTHRRRWRRCECRYQRRLAARPSLVN